MCRERNELVAMKMSEVRARVLWQRTPSKREKRGAENTARARVLWEYKEQRW